MSEILRNRTGWEDEFIPLPGLKHPKWSNAPTSPTSIDYKQTIINQWITFELWEYMDTEEEDGRSENMIKEYVEHT